MKLVKANFKILTPIHGNEILAAIERAGRTCYKSEDSITEESANKFVQMLIKRGHESVLEHQSISVLVVCDRGVSHELVRHRIASFSQESINKKDLEQ
jgi:thymidylate synthase (FAD)